MPEVSALDERKKNILKAVVDDYIATAEPVGSKALVSKYKFNVSSATIRNEMAELESLGYLEQPHTSAGRVPSDKGYRAYVDNLIQVDDLSEDEARAIRQSFHDSIAELTGLVRKASDVLSDQTGYLSLALSPRLHSSYLQQVKMLMIEPGRALVVVVLSAGVVKDRLVRIPEILSSSQLMQVAAAIEEGLAGMTIDDITLVTVASAARNAPLPDSLLNQVLYEAYVAIKQADNLELFIAGQHQLLSYPEFHDIGKTRCFFNTLAHNGMIAGYMSEMKDNELPAGGESGDEEEADGQQQLAQQPSYMIRIGQEITLEGMEDCSLVTTTYKVGDYVAGKIGVIGPRRMAYSKVIANISFVKQTVNEHLRQLARSDEIVEDR